AFRGAGQGLRIEAVPGTQVQRYVVNFTEPYLFDTNVSFNLSGFYFDRRYQDWNENRIGGRTGLGYRLTPDLSVSTTLRAEHVTVDNPRVTTSPQLNAALGEHDLFGGGITLTYDTRDVPFNPTEGRMLTLSFEQTFGSFDYSKVEADFRRYFLVAERADGSGRHVLAFQFRGSVTGSQTPVFENFFAGGFSTLRGFDFRGASPVESGVRIGGEFMFLGTVEYRFPLTADDMLSGVVFCDYGTVEQDIALRPENYRVAPGLGLRIAVPAMGPAPIALDFAFPVASAATDTKQVFSFFVGFGR
ncbi:MAG: outer membrane protein assembly factor, partial [Planctomycetales bacterium]|nr:outer membrane protein assembly factor [Planctomycetales bacterium]